MSKYKFDEFFVEVTRKCNLQCEHCMNGESQDITITHEIIDKIFENADDCRYVSFGGGEPLLEIDMIEYFAKKLSQSNWTTELMHLTTNGTITDGKIIEIFNTFCEQDSNRQAILRISADQFHDASISKKAYDYYCGLPKNERVKIELKDKLGSIKYSGRAVDYIAVNPNVRIDDITGIWMPHLDKHRIRIDGDVVSCGIRIASNGNVSCFEEIAYCDTDKLSIGNILTGKIEDMIKHNNNECLLCCRDLQNIQTAKQFISNINDLYVDAFVGDARITTRIADYIFDRIYSLRKEAHKIFPYVPAQDIITTLPMPKDYMFDIDEEINKVYLCLPLSFQLMKRRDWVRWLFNADFNILQLYTSTKNTEDRAKVTFTVFTLLQHPKLASDDVLKKINSRAKFFRLVTSNFANTPEFQMLSELNDKYKSGDLISSNDMVLPCEIGESFDKNEFNLYKAAQDYLVERQRLEEETNEQISV